MGNYSKQREEIIGIIKELYNHPTAEEIYFLTKKKDPAVSRSTVYRNLGRLVENGTVTQIAVSNGPDRYDYTEGRKPHGHVVCAKCGMIHDFSYNIEEMKNHILDETGIEISIDGTVIKGVCSSCKGEAQK